MTETVPAAILDAATDLLKPFWLGLTKEKLVRALNAHPASDREWACTPLSKKETMKLLKISLSTVNRWIKSGRLKVKKYGNRLVRIDSRSVNALMDFSEVAR